MLQFFKLLKNTLSFSYYKFFYKPYYKDNKKFNYLLNSKNQNLLKKLKKDGYVIIENFISKKECNKIKYEIDLFCKKRTSEVHLAGGYDARIYGFNLASKKAKSFLKNKNIINILGGYCNNNKLIHSLTLGQKTIFKKNNLGSGAGWHVDHTILKYPKAMIYLVDVNEKNGPLQYIKGSNKFLKKIKISLMNKYDISKNKFSNKEVANIIKKNNFRLKTFINKAGCLILFDGNGIHKGSPLKKNNRYSLTNYYYFNTVGGTDFPTIKNQLL